MADRTVNIGIAYNAYVKMPGRQDESLSESSVQQAALDVQSTLMECGLTAVLLPLNRSLKGFLERIQKEEIKIIVNLCEGFQGRPQLEAAVAGLLELQGIPFTGNDSRALSLCQDKFKTKAVLSAHDLPTAPYALLEEVDQPVDLDYPLIVKPNAEDASLGIYSDSVVWNEEDLSRQVSKLVHRYHHPALVESFIDGREFNVAVYEQDGIHALPVSEIDFSGMPDGIPRICGYEAKWFEDHALYEATRPVCPAHVDPVVRDRLQEKAVAAFKAVGCRDYARVDFRMNKNGRISILEVNPNPDISLNAGFARALKAAEIPYADFWLNLINRAHDRRVWS